MLAQKTCETSNLRDVKELGYKLGPKREEEKVWDKHIHKSSSLHVSNPPAVALHYALCMDVKILFLCLFGISGTVSTNNQLISKIPLHLTELPQRLWPLHSSRGGLVTCCWQKKDHPFWQDRGNQKYIFCSSTKKKGQIAQMSISALSWVLSWKAYFTYFKLCLQRFDLPGISMVDQTVELEKGGGISCTNKFVITSNASLAGYPWASQGPSSRKDFPAALLLCIPAGLRIKFAPAVKDSDRP